MLAPSVMRVKLWIMLGNILDFYFLPMVGMALPGVLNPPPPPGIQLNVATTRARREIGSRFRDVVLAPGLCQNPTLTTTTDDGASEAIVTYKVSSPD